MGLFQAWAQQALDGITWADHTYVACPENGQFFDCWSDNHAGPEQREIVEGAGNYALADCYRGTFGPLRDTACMGVYAVDGVCHQSTNCFLYSTGRTLDFQVRGYWLSLLMYGTYGHAFLRWLGVYGYCYWRVGAVAPLLLVGEETVPDIVRKVHASYVSRPQPPHPHEVIVEEAAAVTKHHVPQFKPEKIRDIHIDVLQKKDEITRRGLKGRPLADNLNALAVQAQLDVAKCLGKDEYKALMGVGPGETLNLVELALADAAGQPVPAQTG